MFLFRNTLLHWTVKTGLVVRTAATLLLLVCANNTVVRGGGLNVDTLHEPDH